MGSRNGRYHFFVSIAILSICAIAVIERYRAEPLPNDNALISTKFTNPITGREVAIDSDWKCYVHSKDSLRPIYVFQSATNEGLIVLGLESCAHSTLADYVNGLRQVHSLRNSMQLEGEYKNEGALWKGQGYLADTQHTLNILVFMKKGYFVRVIEMIADNISSYSKDLIGQVVRSFLVNHIFPMGDQNLIN